MAERQNWFGWSQRFDPQYRLVTSGLLPPFWLFLIRLTFAVYALISSIVHIILYLDVSHEPAER